MLERVDGGGRRTQCVRKPLRPFEQMELEQNEVQ